MCFVNCSDDDTPDDPADTITLNMLNEHNGKTYLGESKTYINEANNFVTSSNFISDVGNGAGVGADILPSLTNLTHEVADRKSTRLNSSHPSSSRMPSSA